MKNLNAAFFIYGLAMILALAGTFFMIPAPLNVPAKIAEKGIDKSNPTAQLYLLSHDSMLSAYNLVVTMRAVALISCICLCTLSAFNYIHLKKSEPVGSAKPTPPGTSAAEQPRVPGSGAG
jgi:hypothetical protein